MPVSMHLMVYSQYDRRERGSRFLAWEVCVVQQKLQSGVSPHHAHSHLALPFVYLLSHRHLHLGLPFPPSTFSAAMRAVERDVILIGELEVEKESRWCLQQQQQRRGGSVVVKHG